MPASPVTIDTATTAHVAVLLAIDPHPDPAARAAILRRAMDAGTCRLARLEGSVAGLMTLNDHWFGHRFIELVVVAAPARRRGVASALIRHAIATAPTPKVFTSTNESNLPMRALLDREGFVPSGTIYNLDPRDPELLFMTLVGSPGPLTG